MGKKDKEKIEVTEDNFGELLLKSVKEAVEHAQGKRKLKTTLVKRLRICNYCQKGTETVDEDCVECGFSKPHDHPSQYVTVREEK